MGLDHDSDAEEIVIPKQSGKSLKKASSDVPANRITTITVEVNGQRDRRRFTDDVQIGAIKNDYEMADARALRIRGQGKTVMLNDDDRVGDRLDDEDTLALKPDTVFGHF